MARRPGITAAELRAIIQYDPETGRFSWRERGQEFFKNGRVGSWNAVNAGRPVCGALSSGYLRISIFAEKYAASHLAYLYMTGAWPGYEIDHVNGVRCDNRWANLRPATRAQNCQNRGVRSDNTSGFIGVHFSKPMNKWEAIITVDRKTFRLGFFDDRAAASRAYLEAKRQHHKFQPTVRK
jgi:hypothetical protein